MWERKGGKTEKEWGEVRNRKREGGKRGREMREKEGEGEGQRERERQKEREREGASQRERVGEKEREREEETVGVVLRDRIWGGMWNGKQEDTRAGILHICRDVPFAQHIKY